MSGRRMKAPEPEPPARRDDEDAEDLALPISTGWRKLRPRADEQDEADGAGTHRPEQDGPAGSATPPA